MSFAAIEEMPLEMLLDLEVVDSKVEAAFAAQHGKKDKKKEIPIDFIL